MFLFIVSAVAALSVSALCSVMEAALYAVPWSHIETLRKQGRRSGLILYQLRSDVEKPIAVILTLNTVANTAGASLVGASAVQVFGSEIMGLFVAVFTLLILVFSEILPKTLGVAYARTIAPVIAMPLQLMIRLFSPLLWLISRLAGLVRTRETGPQTTEDDIQAIASLTRRLGLIESSEELVIRNILLLDKKTVQDIMTPRTVVFSLPASMTVAEASHEEELWRYSRIPVYDHEDNEDIVGIVFRRQILETLANDQHQTTISSIMRPVRFVLDTLSLDRLLSKFLESRVHLFVVLDEYGGLSGVVSLEDVLEEILGKEIVDETDEVADLRDLARKQRQQLTNPQ